MGVDPNLPRDLEKLDDVEPALASFILGNEGLGFAKAVHERLLRQIGTPALSRKTHSSNSGWTSVRSGGC